MDHIFILCNLSLGQDECSDGSVVHGLTPLLRAINCILSYTTMGAKTGRVFHAIGVWAELAMHHCLVVVGNLLGMTSKS